MKFSLRISILGLFTTVLVTVAVLIILVNYRVTKNILLDQAQARFANSSSIAEKYIDDFFRPIQQRIDRGDLIAQDLIHPAASEEFRSFLFRCLIGLDHAYAIYWADPEGNFYLLEKSSVDHLTSDSITNSATGRIETKQKFTYAGRPINSAEPSISTYDPRSRPWYTKAVAARNKILSDVYLFQSLTDSKPELGMTYAYPIFGANGNLLGVFAIDVSLKSISQFLGNIQNTSNTKLFVFDAATNLIASNIEKYFTGNAKLKIDEIKMPWFEDAFQLYKQQQHKVFYFDSENTSYLSYFNRLSPLPNNHWFLGVVTPVSDIIGKLQRQLFLTVIVSFNIMILGMLLIWIISAAISRPIIRLADEALGVMRHIDHPIITAINSHIKEIIYLQDSLNSLKRSLCSFARYVPLTLVKNLAASNNIAHVGGENKQVTFAFIDITSFTTISEKMSPPELMSFLSEYFQVMTKIILANQGTVDKYIGDGIMAFWGAPIGDEQHEYHACLSALQMAEALGKLNRKWQAEQKPQLTFRVGINTGMAIIGNVGSEDRLSYTAIGDSVNLASRLEVLNKYYKTSIVVSAGTYQVVKQYFNFRLLDYVAVRGKNEGVHIYELLPSSSQLTDKVKEYNDAFLVAFNNYFTGKWELAYEQFKQLANLWPNDNLIPIYIDRCHDFKTFPPRDWQGIWRFGNEINCF